jgi:hypothetical protein
MNEKLKHSEIKDFVTRLISEPKHYCSSYTKYSELMRFMVYLTGHYEVTITGQRVHYGKSITEAIKFYNKNVAIEYNHNLLHLPIKSIITI